MQYTNSKYMMGYTVQWVTFSLAILGITQSHDYIAHKTLDQISLNLCPSIIALLPLHRGTTINISDRNNGTYMYSYYVNKCKELKPSTYSRAPRNLFYRIV